MSQNFQAGDFLIYQIESAYGLLRILAIDTEGTETVWHLAAYNEMFQDIDNADAALENFENLTINYPHLALTNRAFESTQVARMRNESLTEKELTPLARWRNSGDKQPSDLSIRLLLGFR